MQKFQDVILDQYGNVVQFASVIIYNHGTLVKPTIYSDNGSTIAANPLTTDDLGRYYYYAAAGRYDHAISGSKITSYTETDVCLQDSTGDGVLQNQPAELTGSSFFNYTWATAGNALFQTHLQSFSNLGAGAGTFNHAAFTGYNVGRHSTLSSTPNKPSLIMGMEDHYYDSGGNEEFGMEWYVEYWSPDGTSVQMLRPFYVNVPNYNNSVNHCYIHSDIGTDGLGSNIFYAGAGTPLLDLRPTRVTTFVTFNAAGTVATNSADRVAAGILATLPSNSNGCYVAWANGVAGTSAGDLLLMARSSNPSAIRFYTGSTSLAERWNISSTGGLASASNLRFAHGTSALATNATEGFFHLQSCAGAPTGVPASIPTGQVPWIYDSTNNQIYVYNGAWKKTVALT